MPTQMPMAQIPSSGQTPSIPAYRFRLLGVYDRANGDPIPGVEVIELLTGTKAETPKSGVVSLHYLPEGMSLLRLRKIAYEPLTLHVSISAADTVPITILLQRAVVLETVHVTDTSLSPGLRDARERQKLGFGSFIGEGELRKNDERTLASTIVSRIPGVTSVWVARENATYIASARKACSGPAFSVCRNPSCFVDVYLDGTLLVPPVDVDRLRVRDYAGIEFYHGGAELPLRYNATRNDCGALLLWSRVR